MFLVLALWSEYSSESAACVPYMWLEFFLRCFSTSSTVRPSQDEKNPARVALSQKLLEGQKAALCRNRIVFFCLLNSYILFACDFSGTLFDDITQPEG